MQQSTASVLRADGSGSLAPLSDKSLRTELVAEAIRRAILAGQFRPGERLVERDLAAQLHVSKTPVREALKALARSGLVTTHAYRGTEVRAVTRELVEQIYQLRALLEPEAVRQAVPRHTDASLDEMREALAAAAPAGERGDLVELTLANRRFHELLYGPCANTLLRSLLDDLRDQVALISVAGWRQRHTWSTEANEHRGILEAVERRDADLAAERMHAHIENSLAGLLGSLDG
jgi:DNA-binding GntR family transcriptional regulator